MKFSVKKLQTKRCIYSYRVTMTKLFNYLKSFTSCLMKYILRYKLGIIQEKHTEKSRGLKQIQGI
jgi:hypothetical protein